jgi:5'-phosphate synthase pdxT subunit
VKAGVLALQGDFREHAAMFADAGATPVLVRTPEELATVDCLAIPGGESTTISKLARRFELVEPIRERAAAGMPVFGTCAGMIVMAAEVEGGEPLLSLMDIRVVRNAYGRQVDSFESDVEVSGVGPVRAVFIRAPRVDRVGDEVAAFHPEIAGDSRLHRAVLESAG